MLKTYRGSCHCGAVRYQAEIDLAKGTGKCNCTFCFKSRNWSTLIKPEAFRLLQGSDALAEYRKPGGIADNVFCRHCGVRSFARGHLEQLGGDYVSINVACLNGVDPAELIEAPVTYFDGRNDNWWNRPAETRHL